MIDGGAGTGVDLIERMKSGGSLPSLELAVTRYIADHPMDVVGNTVSSLGALRPLAAAIDAHVPANGLAASPVSFEMVSSSSPSSTRRRRTAALFVSRFVNINTLPSQLRGSLRQSMRHPAQPRCRLDAAPRVAVWGVVRWLKGPAALLPLIRWDLPTA